MRAFEHYSLPCEHDTNYFRENYLKELQTLFSNAVVHSHTKEKNKKGKKPKKKH